MGVHVVPEWVFMMGQNMQLTKAIQKYVSNKAIMGTLY